MEVFTNIRIKIPEDFNYKLDLHMVKLRYMRVKRTKAEEIIRLAQIGFLQETK